jgi:hypothetical protein
MPQGANPMIYGFLAVISLLGVILFTAVRRENKNRAVAIQALTERKRKRRQRNDNES